jgi:hypothetical protein
MKGRKKGRKEERGEWGERGEGEGRKGGRKEGRVGEGMKIIERCWRYESTTGGRQGRTDGRKDGKTEGRTDGRTGDNQCGLIRVSVIRKGGRREGELASTGKYRETVQYTCR